MTYLHRCKNVKSSGVATDYQWHHSPVESGNSNFPEILLLPDVW